MDYNTLVNTMIANEIKRSFDSRSEDNKNVYLRNYQFIKLSSKVILAKHY